MPLDQYQRDPAFHHIDLNYPGLTLVTEQPYIFLIPNFVSEQEADALVAKMDWSDPEPSSEKLSRLGERTSVSVLAQDEEVAQLRGRIARLAQVKLSQMQPLKLTRYDEGGQFLQHTDCSVWLNGTSPVERRTHPEKFPDRFCTVLIYLNDCPEGGCTCWRWLDSCPDFYEQVRQGSDSSAKAWSLKGLMQRKELCIKPKRGTAVVHFPCTAPNAALPLQMDPNAQHESEVVVGAKYVCQQFIWSAEMCSEAVDAGLRQRFNELKEKQPAVPLSAEVI